jgi:hypothetical protein
LGHLRSAVSLSNRRCKFRQLVWSNQSILTCAEGFRECLIDYATDLMNLAIQQPCCLSRGYEFGHKKTSFQFV